MPDLRSGGNNPRVWLHPLILRELASPFIPATLAAALIIAGLEWEAVVGVAVALFFVGVAYAIVVDPWVNRELTHLEADSSGAERSGILKEAPMGLRLRLQAALIALPWLLMLGACSLLGPLDAQENPLLRGGVYICTFITGREVVLTAYLLFFLPGPDSGEKEGGTR